MTIHPDSLPWDKKRQSHGDRPSTSDQTERRSANDLRIRRGVGELIELSKNSVNQYETLLAEIATLMNALKQAAAKQNISLEDRRHRINEILEEVDHQSVIQPVSLPDKPPQLWLKDRRPDETPPEFITRVYKPYLGKGLTRAFFHQPGQDNSLYNALNKWLGKNPAPPDFDLPTKPEANNRKLQDMGIPTASGFSRQAALSLQTREEHRLYLAARRRSMQSQSG